MPTRHTNNNSEEFLTKQANDAMCRKDWLEASRFWAMMREQFPENPSGYVGGVKALREFKDFAAADALVAEAMRVFPKQRELYLENAYIARAACNWPEAVKRWALVREKYPNLKSGYCGGVIALKESKDFEAADALVLFSMEKFPNDVNICIEYCDIAMRRKDWSESDKRWEQMRSKYPEHISGYVGGVIALKESKEFEAADRLVSVALKKFPNEVELYAEYGEIAVSQKNWSEAVNRWALMREKCPQNIRGYVGGIIALKEIKDFEAADALAHNTICFFSNDVIYNNYYNFYQSIDKETIKILTSKADYFFTKKQWGEALVYYLKIIGSDINCLMSNLLKARKCLSYLKDLNPREVLKPCCIEESSYIFKIKNMLFDCHTEEILDVFKTMLQYYLYNPDARKLWQESFNILLKSINGDQLTVTESAACVSDVNESKNNQTIVSVSGMGWSGSGAIYCYLSEFDEFEVIKLEPPMFERDFGFKNIVKNIDTRKNFILSLIDFIFLHLLGIFPYQSIDNIISARFSMKAALIDQLEHINKAQKLINVFAHLIYNYKKFDRIDILKTIGNNLFCFYCKNNNKILLFDNVIHLDNIEIINYIDRMYLFCCIRDPRSHYIALKTENPGFDFTLHSYIKHYKNTLNNFDKNFAKLSNKLSKVYLIQFEQFIISESYRKAIVNKIDANLTHTNKYQNFRPWESLFNAINYRQYDNTDEIVFLHNKLSEHCVDIDQNMVMDVLYECALENARLQTIVNNRAGNPSESNFSLRRYTKFLNM